MLTRPFHVQSILCTTKTFQVTRKWVRASLIKTRSRNRPQSSHLWPQVQADLPRAGGRGPMSAELWGARPHRDHVRDFSCNHGPLQSIGYQGSYTSVLHSKPPDVTLDRADCCFGAHLARVRLPALSYNTASLLWSTILHETNAASSILGWRRTSCGNLSGETEEVRCDATMQYNKVARDHNYTTEHVGAAIDRLRSPRRTTSDHLGPPRTRLCCSFMPQDISGRLRSFPLAATLANPPLPSSYPPPIASWSRASC